MKRRVGECNVWFKKAKCNANVMPRLKQQVIIVIGYGWIRGNEIGQLRIFYMKGGYPFAIQYRGKFFPVFLETTFHLRMR